ncbi:hypothetical protein EJ03DRAFT_332355 [Teratosphaeria nubilosa]|uniref:Uncharacterized protein n=1 Tax=Teratosphaeria nubilosa TaxID=161662 RepID=A0A6G1KTE6_9PEZI|nr:hypothetical protein EJ03DRAFT_332355 [Teratosphaeria nubilosa]
MCYSFVLGGTGHHYDIDDTKHFYTMLHLNSINMPLTQQMQTSGLPLRTQDANAGASSKMSSKRRASSPAHDDERPAKMGKKSASSANGEFQGLAGEKSGNRTLVDARENDDASVVDLGVGSVQAGSCGRTAELGGQDEGGDAGTAMSVSTELEVDRLKQQLADQGGKLKEVNADLKTAQEKVKYLQDLGRSFKHKFEATNTRLVEIELELKNSQAETSEMRAENILLQNQQQETSTTSKNKPDTARAGFKELVKDVEKKCNERWVNKMRKANGDNAAKTTKLKKEHRQYMEKKESAWSNKFDELKQKHQEQQEATKEAFETKKTEWKAKFNKLVGDARADKENAIDSEKQAKKKFAEDIKALKAEQQAEIKKYKPETADAVKELNATLAESNNKIEYLRVKIAMQEDLAARALEDTRTQKSSLAIATDLVEQARAEKEDLKEKLTDKVAEVAEWKEQTKRAFQDVAFHKQKAAEWKMKADGHQRGVHGLNMALQSRDKALDSMRVELRAALNENERLKREEKRLVGELAGVVDEGCA